MPCSYTASTTDDEISIKVWPTPIINCTGAEYSPELFPLNVCVGFFFANETLLSLEMVPIGPMHVERRIYTAHVPPSPPPDLA